MSTVYDIGVLPGDGIGSEVVKEALKVLDAIEQVYGFSTKREVMPYGAEHFLKTGEMMPDAAFERARDLHESEQNLEPNLDLQPNLACRNRTAKPRQTNS